MMEVKAVMPAVQFTMDQCWEGSWRIMEWENSVRGPKVYFYQDIDCRMGEGNGCYLLQTG